MYLCRSILRRTQSPAKITYITYEMYMVRPLVATVNWHKSLQFEKKSNVTLLSCLFKILLAASIIILRLDKHG